MFVTQQVPTPRNGLLVKPNSIKYEYGTKRYYEVKMHCHTQCFLECVTDSGGRFGEKKVQPRPHDFSLKNGWGGKRPWHLKTSDIFSLPRISTKDFPYIKGKID